MFRGHAGGPDALVRIAQGGIDDLNFTLAIGWASARGHDFGEAFCAQFLGTKSSHKSLLRVWLRQDSGGLGLIPFRPCHVSHATPVSTTVNLKLLPKEGFPAVIQAQKH